MEKKYLRGDWCGLLDFNPGILEYMYDLTKDGKSGKRKAIKRTKFLKILKLSMNTTILGLMMFRPMVMINVFGDKKEYRDIPSNTAEIPS